MFQNCLEINEISGFLERKLLTQCDGPEAGNVTRRSLQFSISITNSTVKP